MRTLWKLIVKSSFGVFPIIITASSLIKAYGPIGTVLQDGYSLWGRRAESPEASAGHPGPGWPPALSAGLSVAALRGTAGETPCHLNLESFPEPLEKRLLTSRV